MCRAVAADIAEHLLFGIVHQHVVAQALLPLKGLAAMRADMRRFRCMFRLMDKQSGPRAEAIIALQAEERLSKIRTMTTQVFVIFSPIQKTNFAERTSEVGRLAAGHVINHLLHLITFKVAANAVVDFTA